MWDSDKGCKLLGGICPAMSFFGVEEWGILTLDRCSPQDAKAQEKYWIKNLSPTLNIRDVPSFTQHWELLFRVKIASRPSATLTKGNAPLNVFV